MTERFNQRLRHLRILIEKAKHEASLPGYRGGADAAAVRDHYIKVWIEEFNRIIGVKQHARSN